LAKANGKHEEPGRRRVTAHLDRLLSDAGLAIDPKKLASYHGGSALINPQAARFIQVARFS